MADRRDNDEPIKVTDRRLFTPDGRRRNTDTSGSGEDAEPTVRGEGFELRNDARTEREETKAQRAVDFSSFILSLSSTAFIHLGEMQDPLTGRVEVKLDAARQVIDMLDMLRAKTRGNLDPQEEEFFGGILYELKMKYAQRAAGS